MDPIELIGAYADYSDAELARLYDNARAEIWRRGPRSQSTDPFAEIAGQEHCKRAAVIAMAGSHSLLIVGPPGVGKSMLRGAIATQSKTLTFEARPCPCGCLGSVHMGCVCEPDAVTAHVRRFPAVDIVVEASDVPARELYTPASWRTNTAKVVEQAAISANALDENPGLDRDAKDLLRRAAPDIGLSPADVRRVRNVARTIALLDDSILSIQPHHIAEAINYSIRNFFNR